MNNLPPDRKPLDSLLPFKMREKTVEEVMAFLKTKWDLLKSDVKQFKVIQLEKKVKQKKEPKPKALKEPKPKAKKLKVKPDKTPIPTSQLTFLSDDL